MPCGVTPASAPSQSNHRQRPAEAVSLFHSLKPFLKWLAASSCNTLLTNEAHASFAQAADVFRVLFGPNPTNTITVSTGKRLAFDDTCDRVCNTLVSAGFEPHGYCS